ncbi:hypothetical protein O3M35_005348 [Rhynocoris fuscipes]|uniref:Uncharacterized protein n=1 Tax=Rhynocoris fuscipes TaxID=488301 RepID=A0AAW1DJS8_9HEMI
MTEEEKYPPSPGSDISPVHSDIPEDDEIEVVRKQCIVEMQDELDRLYIQPENYEKMRFETNSVKQLREAKVRV